MDSGKGISPADLKKVGIKGFSSGKSGTGLGIYYAKRFIEESGGTLQIQSKAGTGTTVDISLPAISDFAAVPQELPLRSGMTLVIFDDDPLVLAAVKAKMRPAFLKTRGITCELFQKSAELEQWLAKNVEDFLIITDFNLEGELESGLEVVERLCLTNKSWVFTSAPEDERIKTNARRLGVPILGKDQFFQLPIIILEENRTSQLDATPR